jgi:dipeptidyl aminopeptidase/acylaminoacyl peptidase
MPRIVLPAASALAASVWLAACATPAPPAATGSPATLAPPAAMTLKGVPPVPADLPARVGAYTEFKGASLVDISPDGQRLLVARRAGAPGAERAQLHEMSAAGGPLRQITTANEPTANGAYLPADAKLIVFQRDQGGNEASRVYRRDLATGIETPISPERERCSAGGFDHSGTAVLMRCSKVDAQGGAGAGGAASTVLLVEVKSGKTLGKIELPGTGWFPSDLHPDGRTLLLSRYISASQGEVWQADLASGERKRLLPREGEAPSLTLSGRYSPDGRRFGVVSDRAGEFRQAWRYDPASQVFEPVTSDIPWDVSGGSSSRDGRRIVIITNEAGVGVPRLYDGATLKPLPLPFTVPAGATVTQTALSADGKRLAYATNSARTPNEIRVVELEGPAAGRDALWLAADTAGMDTSGFTPIETISWKSFDGRTITGLIQRPPKKFTGKRPVLIEIHGGPEAQARMGFNGRYNYLVNELGIAFIEPNVRGSTGYGKSFQKLDDGKLREDSVKDIGALLDWIAQQPDLDASRVVVQGGSYGGYMANAVAVHYSDRIRGAIPDVGISNFVTFLERTESYRRDLRRAEYGDERDPAMRAWMEAIAPVNNAGKIRVPMFIVHGRNDPRVPVQEAEQIAATVEKNGVPVWLMIAENEGHGFAKKENADYLFYARLLFLQDRLLK